MNSNQLIQLAFPVLLILIFYFMLIRPQKKREKQISAMRRGLKIGDHVVTIGGIYGKIYRMKDDKLTLELTDKSKVEFARWAISSVVSEVKESKLDKKEKSEKSQPKEETQDNPQITQEETDNKEEA